jgi:hypothetical protein
MSFQPESGETSSGSGCVTLYWEFEAVGAFSIDDRSRLIFTDGTYGL